MEYITIDENYIRMENYFPPYYFKQYENKIINKIKEVSEKKFEEFKLLKLPFCPLIKDECTPYCINFVTNKIDKSKISKNTFYVYKKYCKYFKTSF